MLYAKWDSASGAATGLPYGSSGNEGKYADAGGEGGRPDPEAPRVLFRKTAARLEYGVAVSGMVVISYWSCLFLSWRLDVLRCDAMLLGAVGVSLDLQLRLVQASKG